MEEVSYKKDNKNLKLWSLRGANPIILTVLSRLEPARRRGTFYFRQPRAKRLAPDVLPSLQRSSGGGCVLLNDGTVKFIRTKDELHVLRWK